MQIHFRYRPIGAPFLDQLNALVERGESVVLLGPRNIGKGYVISHLLKHLTGLGYTRLGLVRFLGRSPAHAQVPHHPPAVDPSQVTLLEPNPAAVFAWIDAALAEPGGGQVVLAASHIDSQPYEVTRDFLGQLRDRVAGGPATGRLTTVLAGEADLRQLVSGPNSEFNCAEQFVLQGFSRELFREITRRHAEAFRLRFADPEEVCEALYERTGGNVHLLRMIFWALLDRWTSTAVEWDRPLTVADFPARPVLTQMPWSYHLQHVTRLIGHDPDSWGLIEDLVAGREPAARQNQPELVELAGLATRGEDNRLRPPGTLMRDFLQRYFTPGRFADLYAVNGRWPEAFARYRARVAAADRVRPLTIDDDADVENVVGALCMSLYHEALRGAPPVRRRLVEGCRYILGFSEITFWRQNEGEWRCVSGPEFGPPRADAELYRAVLRAGEAEAWGLLAPPELPGHPVERCAVAARLPKSPTQGPEAVVVGNPAEMTILSWSRHRYVREALRHFATAYEYATQADRRRERLSLRDEHVRIIDGIFAALGTEIRAVGHALKAAAAGLRKLRYSRVVFSLVDPERKRLVGVHEDSEDANATMRRLTDYPLDDPDGALQTWVVLHKQGRIVQDFTREPLYNRGVVEATGARNAVIVPLLTPKGTVIGTLFVERNDGREHTEEEKGDLELFAGNLGTAIVQSERVELLESALDGLRDPVAILNTRFDLRYANGPAARYLGTHPGWRQPEDAKSLREWRASKPDDDVMTEFLAQAKRSLDGHSRLVRHLRITADSKLRDVALLTTPITDWRKTPVGVLCHSQDISYFYQVFEALRLLHGAHDTATLIAATAEAAKVLGHEWGRLWRISRDNPTRFEPDLSFGWQDPAYEEAFKSCPCPLPARGSPGAEESWLCIEQKQPLVFCHKPHDARPVVPNEKGLQAVNVREPNCRGVLAKAVGDYWIDFPLLAGGRPLGKLTLSCSPRYSPENFDFLTVLCEMVSNLLQASLDREKRFDERFHLLEENAEQVLRDTCHHLATNLAAFPALISRYRQVAKGNFAMDTLNARFQNLYTTVTSMVVQTRERLLRAAAERQRTDLIPIIQRAFNGLEGRLDWALEGAPARLEVDLDAPRFESALVEMIQNSRRAAPNPGVLRIVVRVAELQRQDGPWVRVEFADNGPGVPVEFKERIFEPFFSRRPHGERGTGFGLFFVSRVVKAHGGKICEDGVPGQGASFRIEFPQFRRREASDG